MDSAVKSKVFSRENPKNKTKNYVSCYFNQKSIFFSLMSLISPSTFPSRASHPTAVKTSCSTMRDNRERDSASTSPQISNVRHILPASFPMNGTRFVSPSIYMLCSFRILFSRASQPIAPYSCGSVRCVRFRSSVSERGPRFWSTCQIVPA
jgi:hypothetical protein